MAILSSRTTGTVDGSLRSGSYNRSALRGVVRLTPFTHNLDPWKNRRVRLVGCLLVMLAGCALFQEEEVIYLNKAKRLHATQAEVKRRLGIPDVTQSLSNGETMWRYQIWTNTGGDLNGPGESYCDQYSLRFDRQATLREWTHQGC